MMNTSRQKTNRGQALVEYLVIFSFMAMLAIKLAMGLQGFVKTTMGGLSKALTLQLSSGVCQQRCFFKTYNNGI